MNQKPFFLLTLLSVLFICSTAYAQGEEITLSTYYPAPYGEYEELAAENLFCNKQIIGNMDVNGDGQFSTHDDIALVNVGNLLVEGNVGIGTTGPRAKLDVIGQIVAGDSSQYAVLDFDGTRARVAASGAPRPDLTFVTNDANRMVITTAGNVGIGTTGPGAKLTVAGGRAQFTGSTAPSSGAGVEIGYDGTQGMILTYDRIGAAYKDLGLGAGATQLYLKTDGNVGIGTTTPAAKLDVTSTTSGFLPPRMTAAQRDAIPAGNRVPGTIIYNNTTDAMEYWDGLNWICPSKEICIVKPSNEARMGDVLQDDSHLKFTIGPNEIWQFEIVAFCRSNDPGDIQVSLGGPGGGWLEAFAELLWEDAGDSGGYRLKRFNFFADVLTRNFGSSRNVKFTIKGTIFNGLNAGTFSFEWAKRAATATPSSVWRGSYLIARRIG